MKIDSAIKEFTEKYDQEMLESIDRVSKELGYEVNGYTVPAFNLNEAVTSFVSFLEGYGDYKVKNINNEKAESQEKILEQTENFIKEGCFKEAAIKYPDIPDFIKGYVESIKILLDTTDKVKSYMSEADVNPTYVGDVNQMVDQFTEAMQDRFYPVMEKMLWASGYNARRALAKSGKAPEKKVSQNPIFI